MSPVIMCHVVVSSKKKDFDALKMTSLEKYIFEHTFLAFLPVDIFYAIFFQFNKWAIPSKCKSVYKRIVKAFIVHQVLLRAGRSKPPVQSIKM